MGYTHTLLHIYYEIVTYTNIVTDINYFPRLHVLKLMVRMYHDIITTWGIPGKVQSQ